MVVLPPCKFHLYLKILALETKNSKEPFNNSTSCSCIFLSNEYSSFTSFFKIESIFSAVVKFTPNSAKATTPSSHMFIANSHSFMLYIPGSAFTSGYTGFSV